ncbi:hypothetical protein J4Q44_G00307180 [Coregonus suidteri]|uniref:Uncharacterized protein n=1 Tax=Coregonus suidteri TaxID=861788 RepID=A0AAN8QJ71_9TELE
MMKNIHQVLRSLMLLARWGRERLERSLVVDGGGLLVLLWATPGQPPSGQAVNCTVAAAGTWCSGVPVEEVQQEFWQRLGPSASPCPAPDPDPEELCAFTEIYGPLHFLLSLQIPSAHSDPFHSQLSDFMASEELLELHLEDVLRYNREVVTAALNTLLQSTLKDQQQRDKAQEKMWSALGVMLRSIGCVVSSSTNMEFRAACLGRMMVQDTYELSASLHDSLQVLS